MSERLPASARSASVRPTRLALPVLAAVLSVLCGVFPGHAEETVRTRPGIGGGLAQGTVLIVALTDDSERFSRLLFTPNAGPWTSPDAPTYVLDGADTRVAIEPKAGGASVLTPETSAYEAGFKALFVLFVLAVILESALGLLFDWRPFVENLDARSVKPLVSFAVAFILVSSFELDLVRDFVDAVRPGGVGASRIGPFLTAMVLGGGSAGVHNILVALGYRQTRTPETVSRRPPPDKAWISVRVERVRAVGPIEVFVDAASSEPGPVAVPAAGGAPSSLIGVIQPGGRPLRDYFLTSRDRFPGYGGHAVDAGALVSLKVVGREATSAGGKTVECRVAPFRAAGGARIDLAVDL